MGFYWEAVRLGICRRCIEGDGAGNCHLPVGEACALVEFFPEIVHTVNAVQSELLEHHRDAVRSEICSHCSFQLPDGFCLKRKNQSCALDRFFPLVVEAITGVKKTTLHAG